MAWIEKLYATYEACAGNEPPGAEKLLPVSHAIQQAHIEIIIDQEGKVRDARTVNKIETVIPATEESAGRSGIRPAPHPLSDKVRYCARDYSGPGLSFHDAYKENLAAWCESEHRHPKAVAVLKCIETVDLVAELVSHGVLKRGADGELLTVWTEGGDLPAIFRMLTAKQGRRDQGDAFVRWIVREPGSLCDETWLDESLQKAWINYDASRASQKGRCLVSGDDEVGLASNYPKRIRHAADGAKLVSANDSRGYTFRGRFTDDDGKQACSIGKVVTQKAHSALRWLIARQAYRNDEQVYVAWSVGGKPIPDPCKDSAALLLGIAVEPIEPEKSVGDVGQAFARRLRQAMQGYAARITPNDDIVVIGLDSATPGRMAIIYYRELKGSDFLERIEAWHSRCAWAQDFAKDRKFVGAPAPHDIAEAAYGRRLDDKLKKTTVERLLPCIIDGQAIPRELVLATTRRACNRVALEHWEWEKVLGIACALFRGWSEFQGKDYAMALEEDRTTRDYLYGRLLAVAEGIESYALYLAGEKRDTTAARLMQRFADRPFSTWRTIELALTPYKIRLRASAKGAGVLWKQEKLLDEIQCRLASADFTDDRALSGEFLLGYHCQRAALRAGSTKTDDTETIEDQTGEQA